MGCEIVMEVVTGVACKAATRAANRHHRIVLPAYTTARVPGRMSMGRCPEGLWTKGGEGHFGDAVAWCGS